MDKAAEEEDAPAEECLEMSQEDEEQPRIRVKREREESWEDYAGASSLKKNKRARRRQQKKKRKLQKRLDRERYGSLILG
jgi:hypothetical protein